MSPGRSTATSTTQATRSESVVFSVFAELERDLIAARTREALAVPERRATMTGCAPKLSPTQKNQVPRLHNEGEHTPIEIGAMFGVSRQTVDRVVGDVGGRHEYSKAEELSGRGPGLR